MRWFFLVLWLGCFGLGCFGMGCSGGQPVKEPTRHAVPRRVAPPARAKASKSVLSVSGIEGSFGPYRALAGDQAVLLWAADSEEGSHSWYSLITDAKGQPRTRPLQLSPAADQVDLVRVRAVPHGFLALISAKGDQDFSLETLSLGDGGQLQGGSLLSRPTGEVAWLDVFPLADRALVAWAAMTESGRADVFAASISLKGALLSQPQLVASSATAWQGLLLDDEVAIATVVPTRSDQSSGKVELRFLNQAGVLSPKLELSKAATARPDIDLARVGDRLVCAWSDISERMAHIHTAVVDAQGRVQSEARLAASGAAEQALVRIVAGKRATHAFVLWENISPNIGAERDFRLSRVDATGAKLGSELAVYYDAEGGVPELEATETGAVVLSQIHNCVGDDCAAAPPIAYYAVVDQDLRVVGSAPVAVAAPKPLAPDAVWGLECAGRCSALATFKETSARIFTVQLPTGVQSAPTAVAPVDAASRPRVSQVSVLAETDPLAKVTAVTTARGSLVTWLTDFDPDAATGAKKTTPDSKAPQALLQTQLVSSDGTSSTPETISFRARSLGGVAIAHNSKTSESLLVWSALDQGKPHVFVTLVDASGKKLKQRMLTQTPGEVYDTAAVVVDDGFVVAWVDARSGAPKAYATKIDDQLTRRMPDKPLSSGSVSGLAIELAAGQLMVVYAEANDASGNEAVYLARLDSNDPGIVSGVTRLSSGLRHAYSPELAPTRGGWCVLWLEDESQQPDAATSLLWSAVLGGVATAPAEVELGNFSANSATILCNEKGCQLAILAREANQRAALLAGQVLQVGGNATQPEALSEVDATGLLTAPALLPSGIFLGDVGRDGRGWVKRLRVDW